MMNIEQQLKSIKYSIMHLEGEIRSLRYAQRNNLHEEIKRSLQVEIEVLEDDLSMFNRVAYSYQTKRSD